jgi:hypothetical protein
LLELEIPDRQSPGPTTQERDEARAGAALNSPPRTSRRSPDRPTRSG